MPPDKHSRTDKSSIPSSTTPGGLVRNDEDITAQEEALANNLANQASDQADPHTDDPREASARETENGVRADLAAGIQPHRDQLADSERAFSESRGSNEPRTPGYLRDKK